jgi:hypothetical protein
MANLGTLTSFKVAKNYGNGMTDLQKTIGGVTYEIFIDPINSGVKVQSSGKKIVDPKNFKYGAGISYDKGVYALKRNIKTKIEAKGILQKAMEKIEKATSVAEKKSIIKKLSGIKTL